MKNKKVYDCLIIGAGPAGLTSALYAQRAGLNCLIIEKDTPGGKMSKTSIIENYPGFQSIKGFEISLNMLNQAKDAGVTYLYGDVTNISKKENIFELKIVNEESMFGKTVIIATGMKEKKVCVPGEEKFYGNGVSYCAICDGSLYKDKEVIVVGGGSSAFEESIYLSQLARKVYLIHRTDKFRAEQKIIDKVKSESKIELITNTILKSINGENKVTGVTVNNVLNKIDKDIRIDGVFIFIGYNPETSFIDKNIVDIKENFIVTNKDMETKTPGLYSVGDVNQKKFRQISTAVSDGTIAALNVKKYIENNFDN
ncbi:MAG: thioredoxin-disulfide reductase [Mycoplasmoidaceae bacterium]